MISVGIDDLHLGQSSYRVTVIFSNVERDRIGTGYSMSISLSYMERTTARKRIAGHAIYRNSGAKNKRRLYDLLLLSRRSDDQELGFCGNG